LVASSPIGGIPIFHICLWKILGALLRILYYQSIVSNPFSVQVPSQNSSHRYTLLISAQTSPGQQSSP
ncbi:hypothetical protein BGW80DRAFT_1563067, partial [Lactifluus volemus]